MRLRGTRRARLIALVLVLATLGVGGLLLYRRALYLYEHLGEILVDRLQQQLGREVAIGRLDARHIGRVILYDVAIAERARLAEGTLLRTPRVVLNYRWDEMIWGTRDVMAALTEIIVESPSGLLERDPTGDWNVAKLFRPRRPGKPSLFRGRILVRNGQIIFRDYLARTAQRPALNEIRHVDATVSFAAHPTVTADVGGVAAARRAGRLQVEYFFDPRTTRWLTTARAQDVDAAYWSSYLFSTPQGEIRAGRADLAMTIAREGKGPINPLQFTVVGEGRGLTLVSPRLHRPLTDVTASFQADSSGLTLAGKGLLADMPLRVSGRVLGWRQPILALQGDAEGVTLARARSAFPELPPASDVQLPAPATLQARIEGPALDPLVRGTIHVPAAVVTGVRIAEARSDFRYFQRRLQLSNLTARGAEGTLKASAWLDLRQRPVRLYAAGSASDLTLRALTERTREPLAGTVTGRFVVAGTPGKWNGAASVSARSLQFAGRTVEQGVARLSMEAGHIRVDRLVATDPKGTLIAWGDVSPGGELALRLRASGLDLGKWVSPREPGSVSGTAFLTGELVGTLREPRLVADVDFYDAHLGEITVDFGRGHLTASREAVTLDPEKGLVARLYPAELQVRGEIRAPTSPEPVLDLHATVKDLDIGRFLADQGGEPAVAGTLSGTLTIGGTARKPEGSGSFRLEETTVRGIELGTLAADARLDGQRLALANLRAEGGPLKLTGEGSVGLMAPADRTAVATITRASPLRFAISIAGFDLRPFNAQTAPYVDLAGTLAFPRIQVDGTVGSPTVAGSLAATPITINGQSFPRLAAGFRWDGSAIRLTDGVLDAGPGSVTIPTASYQVARTGAARERRRLEVTGKFNELPISKLLAVIRDSSYLGTPAGASLLRLIARVPKDVDGQLSGTVDAAPGAVGNRITLRLEPSALKLPSLQIPTTEAIQTVGTAPPPSAPLVLTLEGSAAYEAGRLTVPLFKMSRSEDEAQLVLRQGLLIREGARDAAGVVQPEGRLQASLDAYSLPLRVIGVFLPEVWPLAGRVELHVNADGPLRRPTIEGNADAENPVIAGIPFSRLFVGRVVLAGDRITVDSARLVILHQGHEHRLAVETPPGGAVPFDWESFTIPRNRPRQLVVRLDEQDLSVLEELAAAKNPNPRIAPLIHALHGISKVQGRIAASIMFGGTGEAPQNTGEVRLTDVAFALPGGQTDIRNVQAQLAFAGDQVQVQRFTGASSRGGQFEVGGKIDLGRGAPPSGPLDLTLRVADLQIAGRNISGLLQETVSTTLRTVGATDARGRVPAGAPIEALHITGTFASPLISGSGGTRGGILLTRSRLTLPAVLPEATTREENPRFNPRFNFAVIAGDDVTVRNPNLQVQLRGAVPVSGSLARPVIRGTLEVVQGMIRFPAAPPFRLTGQIAISYAPGLEGAELAPLRVDLIARGVTRGINPGTGQMQRYEITLNIRGGLTADPLRLTALEQEQDIPIGLRRLGGAGLSIHATSQPPLSETQILALLGRQSDLEGIIAGRYNIEQGFERMLGSSVFPTLLAPTEVRVAEALGLEEFGVEFAFREPIRVRIGKRLFDGFYGTYIRNFVAQEEQYSFELYRKVSDRLRLGYRIEEPTNRRVWLMEGSFRF